jgi:hypothetical protein
VASHDPVVGTDDRSLSIIGRVAAVNLTTRSRSTRSVRTWPAVAALCGWTAFLWITRIKNALGDADMSTGGKAIALVTSLAFLGAAVALAFVHLRNRPEARRAAAAFALVSIVYWLIRAATIVARDHPVGFTVVHTVLALITVGLGVWVLRSASARSGDRRPARTPV